MAKSLATLLICSCLTGAVDPRVVSDGSDVRSFGCPSMVRVPTEVGSSDYVELHHGPCMFGCWVYTVRVQADGTVSWKGESAVREKGTASGKVPAAVAKELIERFRTHEFWALCDSYRRLVTDSSTTETTASIGGELKRVSSYAGGAPDLLKELDRQIEAVANTHFWRHGDPKDEIFGAQMASECALPKPGMTALMCSNTLDGREFDELVRSSGNVNAADASGWTALMYAAYRRDNRVFYRLLNAGADAKATSATGQNAIAAVIAGYSRSKYKIEQLVRAGADINAADTEGKTALMLAVQRSFPDETEWLVANGARVDMRDVKGRTAFDYLEATYAKRGISTDSTPAYFQIRAVLQSASRIEPPVLSAPVPPGSVSIGQTVDEVRSVLGEPEFASMGGSTTIYKYLDLQITFIDGKATKIENHAR